MAKQKKRQVKDRNPLVIAMMTHSYGAGSHGDAKKERNRRACRGKVSVDE